MRSAIQPVTAIVLAALARPVLAQSPIERLDVHGFLTQGVAVSSDAPLFGVPTEATMNYRSAALQLRYRLTGADHLVLQLDHRRLGGSLLTTDAGWVGLDWAFYQRFFGGLDIRAGRVPMPQGIYNEIRDVGTLLPFYRAPGNFYMEGFETVDGAVVSYRQPVGVWDLEASLFAGAFDFKAIRTSPAGPELTVQRRKNSVGAQLWIETPVTGLRLGAGAVRWDVETDDGDAGEFSWRAALDGRFDRVLARAEYRAMDHVSHFMASYYGQFGFRVTERVALHTQAEFEDRRMMMAMPMDGGMGGMAAGEQGAGAARELAYRYASDWAVGANYRLGPNIVFKLEAHRAEGYNFDRFFDPTDVPGTTDYAIAGIALAF